MTSAVLGAGSTLKVDISATLTLISEVLRCGPIGSVASEVDVTNLDSIAKEYIGGLPDGESVEFEVNWITGNAAQEYVRDAVGSTESFEMTFADTDTATFDMVILGFSRGETSPESQLTASLNGRITGDITWA